MTKTKTWRVMLTLETDNPEVHSKMVSTYVRELIEDSTTLVKLTRIETVEVTKHE